MGQERMFRSALTFSGADTRWVSEPVDPTFSSSGKLISLNESPPGRWWHDDTKGGQSGSEGLFEVVSGVIPIRANATTDAVTLGILRAGMRFCGTPDHRGKSTWIKLRSHGVLPPVFAPGGPEPERVRAPLAASRQRRRSRRGSASQPDLLPDGAIVEDTAGHRRGSRGSIEDTAGHRRGSRCSIMSEDRVQTPTEHICNRLYRTSVRHPLLREPGLELCEDVWVQYNKQYIHRLRDTNRERGFASYSNLSSCSWTSMKPRDWRSTLAKRFVVPPMVIAPPPSADLNGGKAARLMKPTSQEAELQQRQLEELQRLEAKQAAERQRNANEQRQLEERQRLGAELEQRQLEERQRLEARQKAERQRQANEQRQLEERQRQEAEQAMTKDLSWCNVVPYGVLGDHGAAPDAGGPPDGRIAIVDPAGVHFMQNGPTGAEGGAGAIYKWLGIYNDSSFPVAVRDSVKKELQAKYFAYGKDNATKHVIHVVSPNLGSKNYSRAEAVAELAQAYGNVLNEFCASFLRELRLLPVSAGSFAGPFHSEMSGITADALRKAFDSLPSKKQVQVRASHVEMCIFGGHGIAAYDTAFKLV